MYLIIGKMHFSPGMGELPLVGCLEISRALSQHPSPDDLYELVTTKQVGGRLYSTSMMQFAIIT